MKKTKYLLTAVLLLAAMLLVTGCADSQTPYQAANGENYTVSVKFDANGGFFTTNTSVIVDSYNLDQLPVGTNGQAQIALIPTDHQARGNDAFAPVKAGHFLAGWYRERQQTADDAGNITYTYAGKWDFAQDLVEVDPKGSYSAETPVLTLYAAWVPMFQVEFVSRTTGETLGTYEFDPTAGGDLRIPQWSQETGAIEMYKFPVISGHTYDGAYYDAQGKQPVTGEALLHAGTLDAAAGTAQNATQKVYVDYLEGQWFHIYNVNQFLDHATIGSSLILHADLDFTGKTWPTGLMHGKFTGAIQGNGHTISNVALEQTNNSKEFAGLFGRLEDSAQLKDISFENITLTLKKGTRKAGSSFGLLAGAISQQAQLSGVSVTGQLLIDSGCYFGTEDYTIGLVCGTGKWDCLAHSSITCAPTGEAPEKVRITLDGNAVTVVLD